MLGVEVGHLELIATKSDRLYLYRPRDKKDGSRRDTWDAQPQLKHLHEQIKNCVLRKVRFPLFLQGGILDKEFPRDYARNAAFHAGAHCVVTLDIENFFPSTTAEQVRDIWSRVFRFEEEVARILTALTTKNRFLPQGAKTSNYLANLVFWCDEHELVSHLAGRGWTYSRLADDITLSTMRAPVGSALTAITKTAIGFIQRHGYHVKRSKQKVYWRSGPMTVNNLVVNVHPALPKSERRRIRAQGSTLRTALSSGDSVDPHFISSTRGKIARLRRFHHNADRILGIAVSE